MQSASPSTTGTEPSRPSRPGVTRPGPSRDCARQTAWMLALLGLLGLTLGACTDVTTYYNLPTEQVHRQRLLLLEPAVLEPTPPAIHARTQAQVRAALLASPDVGEVLDGAEVRRRPQLPLAIASAYDQFTNTLALTGFSDPELAIRLHKGLDVGLLLTVQPAFQPCAVCEAGDQVWVVGQLVDAATGRLAFRAHLVANAEPDALAAQFETLTQDYLAEQALAFTLRPHRLRFNHLRALAGS